MCSQRTSTIASLRFRRIAGLIIVPILPPNNAHSILASATGLSAHPISKPSPPQLKFCAPFEYALSSSVFFLPFLCSANQRTPCNQQHLVHCLSPLVLYSNTARNRIRYCNTSQKWYCIQYS